MGTEIMKRSPKEAPLVTLRKGAVAPQLTLPSALSVSVLLLPAASGFCPGGAGLPVGVPGSLQVSGLEGWNPRGWARPGQPYSLRALLPLALKSGH